MKKITEKYYLDYFIVFVLLCILEVFLLVYAIMHPRLHHIALVVFNGVFVHLHRNWMNKAKFASPYEYDKAVRNWNKRKKEAKKQGVDFYEPKPVIPKKMGTKFLITFICALVLGVQIYGASSIFSIMFPLRMPYEYKGDIADFKSRHSESFYFFPDELPESATHVMWYVMPSYMQGNGMTVLIFDASAEYIQDVIYTYGKDDQICEIEDDMSFLTVYDKERRNDLTIYKFYDNDDWNHVHMWGFFVDEEIGRIGYYVL